jgi:hypothetical protein
MTLCNSAKATVLAFAVFLVQVLPGMGATLNRPPVHPPIPATISQDYSTLPIWVEETKILDATGLPNRELLGDSTGTIQRILQTPERNGCHHEGAISVDYAGAPPRGSLTEAVRTARIAVLAKITAKAPGMYGGIPGELFQIRPETETTHLLKSDDYYYFFIPIGSLRIGKELICKDDDAYGAVPEVGGEVFLFIGATVGLKRHLLYVYGPGDVVSVSRNGSLLLPPHFQVAESSANLPGAGMRTKAALLQRMKLEATAKEVVK